MSLEESSGVIDVCVTIVNGTVERDVEVTMTFLPGNATGNLIIKR